MERPEVAFWERGLPVPVCKSRGICKIPPTGTGSPRSQVAVYSELIRAAGAVLGRAMTSLTVPTALTFVVNNVNEVNKVGHSIFPRARVKAPKTAL